jgi:hypothetical protein
MARKPRLVFGGAIYHIISRGNYRKALWSKEARLPHRIFALGCDGKKMGYCRSSNLNSFGELRDRFGEKDCRVHGKDPK